MKRQLISSPHGTLDAALIVPPMPSTIAFAMESPSPVPGMSFRFYRADNAKDIPVPGMSFALSAR